MREGTPVRFVFDSLFRPLRLHLSPQSPSTFHRLLYFASLATIWTLGTGYFLPARRWKWHSSKLQNCPLCLSSLRRSRDFTTDIYIFNIFNSVFYLFVLFIFVSYIFILYSYLFIYLLFSAVCRLFRILQTLHSFRGINKTNNKLKTNDNSACGVVRRRLFLTQ